VKENTLQYFGVDVRDVCCCFHIRYSLIIVTINNKPEALLWGAFQSDTPSPRITRGFQASHVEPPGCQKSRPGTHPRLRRWGFFISPDEENA
jgi:hypothetical protein